MVADNTFQCSISPALRYKCYNTDDQGPVARVKTRLHALQAFDPHRTKTNEQVSSFINILLEVCPEGVLFKLPTFSFIETWNSYKK